MRRISRHIRLNAGLYAALALGLAALHVALEGLLFGRVKAFGIGRGHITAESSPFEFWTILVLAMAAIPLFGWAAASALRVDRAIQDRISLEKEIERRRR